MSEHDGHVGAWRWAQNFDCAWYDATLDAGHWFSLTDVLPSKAAMLLCGLNPNEGGGTRTARQVTSKEIEPMDLQRLTDSFKDRRGSNPPPHSLLDWADFARDNGLKHHSWVRQYIEARRDCFGPEVGDAVQSTPLGAMVESPEPNSLIETAEKRQARRYAACIAAGLHMPKDDYAHLPRGVGKIAKDEGVTRQAFAEDLKAHIRRLGRPKSRITEKR